MLYRTVWVVTLFVGSSLGQAGEPSITLLYKQHRWFELRAAIHTVRADGFYRGAVACAFNELEICQELLRGAIRSAPASQQSYSAHEVLENAYLRTGLYPRALSEARLRLTLRPGDADAKRDIELLAAFPESQSVKRTRASLINYRAGNGIPVAINGRWGRYSFDTGAAMSFISEAEAHRMGLRINKSKAAVGNITGHSVGLSTAIADRLTVGHCQLRHVAFMIFPDDRPPFPGTPIDHRGVLGAPVLLALTTIAWHDGIMEIGFPPAKENVTRPNLAFDDTTPIIRATALGQETTFLLDTGAQETFLYHPFMNEFSALVQSSKGDSSQTVTGVGQSVRIETIRLPVLTITIGDFQTTLRQVRLLMQKTTRGSDWYAGNLGMDFLGQAHRVTLDFKSMTAKLQ